MKGLLNLILNVKNIPIVGDIIENIQSADGGEGKTDWKKLANFIIRMVILVVTTYLIFKGEASIEDLKTI